MKEGIYLTRLENMEKVISENALTFGRQLARFYARVAAIEEMFITGPEDAGFFKSRRLILKNGLLTFLAPRTVADLLSKREEEILSTMKELAEQRILDESLEKMKGKQANPKQPPDNVEEHKP